MVFSPDWGHFPNNCLHLTCPSSIHPLFSIGIFYLLPSDSNLHHHLLSTQKLKTRFAKLRGKTALVKAYQPNTLATIMDSLSLSPLLFFFIFFFFHFLFNLSCHFMEQVESTNSRRIWHHSTSPYQLANST